MGVTILGFLGILAASLLSGGGNTQSPTQSPSPTITPSPTTTTTTTTSSSSSASSCSVCDCILGGYTPLPAPPDDSSLAVTDEDWPLEPAPLVSLALPTEPDDLTGATSPIIGPTRRDWKRDSFGAHYGNSFQRETNGTSPNNFINLFKRYESCTIAYVNDRYPRYVILRCDQ